MPAAVRQLRLGPGETPARVVYLSVGVRYDGIMSDYARHEHHDFLGASRQALADPPLQAALVRLTSTLMAGNRRGYANLADIDALRDHAKRIKEHALAHLDHYLEQLEASVQRLGGHVHWAATADDARRIVME